MKVKLNLLLSKDNYRDGYQNICPMIENDPKIMYGDVSDLAWCVDDDEVDEILVLDDILSYFPMAKTLVILDNWCKKLKAGGELTILTTDLVLLSKAIVNRSINLETGNVLLYGEQNEAWKFKKVCLSTEVLVNMITERNFKIQKKVVEGVSVLVTSLKR